MQSGVLKKLRDLPLYGKYMTNDQRVKQAVEYNFMARDLIPWKLSCDETNMTRADIVSQLS